MDARQLREQSKAKVESLGYRFNPNLPIIDALEITRGKNEVLDRTLALHACAAHAYGLSQSQAMQWLEQEGLVNGLTDFEVRFLGGEFEANRLIFQSRVETLWALAWAAGHVAELDFRQPCSNDFVKMLPDINVNASSDDFRQESRLRTSNEVVAMVDLAYCLHWAVRDERLSGRLSKRKQLQDQAIIERRLALEWLTCEEPWDDVPLDT